MASQEIAIALPMQTDDPSGFNYYREQNSAGSIQLYIAGERLLNPY